ncbi:EutN/CcmL family microcompartment protein [Alkaliphilus peptidifermentans]|uniref:Ethanolamine utilization protein EutN n=1 Tax=Alkaliphilus peptidifermentans DSM 18978 TaxID=1120976 RepID=A0A1G5AB03_9FIRM|nr:EutN/CcmL family microcompartment protein [Alkaliphilus peptidifermentans]SCX75021.1 ethanolamine utilization protein EutN [Alkaliphilus peptidifermentans DSM 18978]
MYVGKVIGMVVATRKDDNLVGKKLLIVQQTDMKGNPSGNEEIAVDSVGAGTGEFVLVAKGSPARQVFDNPNSPIDAAIVGIIDNIEVKS